MSKMKEMYVEEMNKQREATMDEDYQLYKEALEHKTSLFDDEFDEIPFTVDFSKIEGIGECPDPTHCAIMVSGSLCVIKTPYEIAKRLWNVVK